MIPSERNTHVPDESPNDRDLLIRDRILAGDRQEAERFFSGHLDSLYEFVHYRVGGDPRLCEELVQETFLTALERLRSFDGRSRLYTWLCGIARNKIRAHRRQRVPATLDSLLAELDPEIDRILADIETRALPEWILERRETRDMVGATLSSLPPEYRRALVGKYVDELSTAEIAAREGRGEKATESMLHRARLAFSRVFQLLAGRRGGLS